MEQAIAKAKKAYQDDMAEGHHCLDLRSVGYSLDKKRMLFIPSNIGRYAVKEGTEVVFGQGVRVNDYMTDIRFLLLPDSVSVIMENAFCECKNLKQVVFGKGLKMICAHAFEECGLTSVILPEGIIAVCDNCFHNNRSLEIVYLPESIQFIGKDAFKGCGKLSTIYIPKGLRKKFENFLPYNYTEINYTSWDKEATFNAFRKSYIVKPKHSSGYDYDNDYDKDTWDAMTGGEDYPDEGFDGDYEFMGY